MQVRVDMRRSDAWQQRPHRRSRGEDDDALVLGPRFLAKGSEGQGRGGGGGGGSSGDGDPRTRGPEPGNLRRRDACVVEHQLRASDEDLGEETTATTMTKEMKKKKKKGRKKKARRRRKKKERKKERRRRRRRRGDARVSQGAGDRGGQAPARRRAGDLVVHARDGVRLPVDGDRHGPYHGSPEAQGEVLEAVVREVVHEPVAPAREIQDDQARAYEA